MFPSLKEGMMLKIVKSRHYNEIFLRASSLPEEIHRAEMLERELAIAGTVNDNLRAEISTLEEKAKAYDQIVDALNMPISIDRQVKQTANEGFSYRSGLGMSPRDSEEEEGLRQ